MRVLLWHGWLLEGSGSNVATAKVAEALRTAGHDVLLLCQEPHPERTGFIDAWGTVDARAVSTLTPTGAAPAAGRLVLLRPDVGKLLPVFVVDEYEGFVVKRFIDLDERELSAYLERNAAALRVAAGHHGAEAVMAGHVIPGALVAQGAFRRGRYIVWVHGSDLEYAIRAQPRYRALAAEGLAGAAAVVGSTRDVLYRTIELIPVVAGKERVVPPGVDVERFRPAPRTRALQDVAAALEDDPAVARGRPAAIDEEVARALAARDAAALDALALRYDQSAPDPGAAEALRALSAEEGPLVGYLGKFIPQKGVHVLIEALARMRTPTKALVVGFGPHREWLAALVQALDAGDRDAVAWLGEAGRVEVNLPDDLAPADGLRSRVTFTGRLDHRYAPGVLAALDVLVVPSILDEAFGMVAAEGAAAGALPLLARHSGLAEVAGALENAVGHPELFSFLPGPGEGARIAAGADRLLDLDPGARAELRARVSGFVAETWTWDRTAERLLQAFGPRSAI